METHNAMEMDAGEVEHNYHDHRLAQRNKKQGLVRMIDS